MTYEQYGSGDFGVSIQTSDLNGQYRFPTAEEARAFQSRNGGRLFKTKAQMGSVFDAAAAGDRADPRPPVNVGNFPK